MKKKIEINIIFKYFKNRGKGILQRIYTQNIDALEHIAGVPEEKIIEAHGTFHRAYCTKCKKFYNLPWLKERVFDCGEGESNVPKCEECGGVVRVSLLYIGIVFFL